MILTTDELVERFELWAIHLDLTLRAPPNASDSELRCSLARQETLLWALNNLKRIRDEIDAEYGSKS